MVDAKVVRCNIILGEKFVGQLLKDVETAGEEKDAARTRKRYERLLNDNYVNNNQAIKWCPVRVLLQLRACYIPRCCMRSSRLLSHHADIVAPAAGWSGTGDGLFKRCADQGLVR